MATRHILSIPFPFNANELKFIVVLPKKKNLWKEALLYYTILFYPQIHLDILDFFLNWKTKNYTD